MAQKAKINPHDLIPTFWRVIYVYTREDLIFLGTNNLEKLKQYWRGKEREACHIIKSYQSKIDFMEGKTPEDFVRLSEKYDDPDIGHICTFSRSGQRIPVDKESVNRKAGTTTFNRCGWCSHCDCYTGIYDYSVKGACSLLPEDDPNKENCVFSRCVFKHITPEGIQKCIDYLKDCRAKWIAKKAKAGTYVRYIVQAMKEAEEKPYLPKLRPYDWFRIDDEVICFINHDDAIEPNVFITGKVIDGYRYLEGCVSVLLDKKAHHNYSFHEGRGIGYGLARPEVMHSWEYEYLKAHEDFARLWVSQCDDFSEFDSTEFWLTIIG